MSPRDITQELLDAVLASCERSARVAHARGDAVGGGALLPRGQSLEAPDLSALVVGDAVNVGPLESAGDDTGIAGNELRVAVARRPAGGAIWQLRGRRVDDLNWSNVLVKVPAFLGSDDHVIVVNGLSIVLWVRKLGRSVCAVNL